MSTMLRFALGASVVGGALAAVSAFLSWSKGGFSITSSSGTETQEGTSSTAGIDITEGKVALAVGILVVAAAIVWLIVKGPTPRRLTNFLVFAGGVALLVIGIAQVAGISGEEGLVLSGLTQSGEEVSIGSKTTVGLGLWLTIAGGALAAGGAVLVFLGGRSVPGAPPPLASD